jgi:hypothetical protein
MASIRALQWQTAGMQVASSLEANATAAVQRAGRHAQGSPPVVTFIINRPFKIAHICRWPVNKQTRQRQQRRCHAQGSPLVVTCIINRLFQTLSGLPPRNPASLGCRLIAFMSSLRGDMFPRFTCEYRLYIHPQMSTETHMNNLDLPCPLYYFSIAFQLAAGQLMMVSSHA